MNSLRRKLFTNNTLETIVDAYIFDVITYNCPLYIVILSGRKLLYWKHIVTNVHGVQILYVIPLIL